MNRLIGVLVWKNGSIVQSEKFLHPNVIHSDPLFAIESFRSDDLDELVILNVSREESSVSNFLVDLERITRKVRIPVAAGGFIKSTNIAHKFLECGADKLIVNTAIVESPDLIIDLSLKYGSSTIVASVDVREERFSNVPKVYINRGKFETSYNLSDWLELVEGLKVGEILFNSINHDGARKGYDLRSLAYIARNTSLPLIGFGGVSNWIHLAEGLRVGCSGVAFANALYYLEFAPRKAKKYLMEEGFNMRAWS